MPPSPLSATKTPLPRPGRACDANSAAHLLTKDTLNQSEEGATAFMGLGGPAQFVDQQPQASRASPQPHVLGCPDITSPAPPQ